MRRWPSLALLPVILLAATVAATPSPARAIDVGASCVDAEEAATVALINEYRAGNGLGPVWATQTLSAASEHHSASMAANNYFSHDLIPEGISWSQNMTNHGYTYNTWRGENLAGGQTSAAQVFEGWRNSPGHNAAMLSADFTAIGIGAVYNAASTYGWYWTTDFGGYVDAPSALCGGGTMPAPGGTAPAPTQEPAAAPAPTRKPAADKASRFCQRHPNARRCQ